MQPGPPSPPAYPVSLVFEPGWDAAGAPIMVFSVKIAPGKLQFPMTQQALDLFADQARTAAEANKARLHLPPGTRMPTGPVVSP